MTTPHDTAELMKTWIRAGAASRGCAPPTAEGEGWRVEVNAPEQLRRHVFAGDCAALRELGTTVDEPWVWLKACMSAESLRALLPPRWTVRDVPSYFMTFDAMPPTAPPLPTGYTLAVTHEAGVAHACIHAADGVLAADGRVVVMDGCATVDRIGTHEAHRRRGLGLAIMGALHADASDRGADRGLLVATAAGHALYTTLGWVVQAPYASAVIAPA